MIKNLDQSSLKFPQDERLSFQEEGHIYLLDGVRQLTSVSNVYGKYFKPFDSRQWAIKKSQHLNLTPEELMEQWECNGLRASKIGTHLHRQIESFLNGEDFMASLCHFSYEGKYYKTEPEIISIKKEIELFHRFIKEVKFNPFRTEWKVFDEELGVAGTIDLIARCDDGSYELYDWKRSKTLIDDWGYPCKTNRFNVTGTNGLEHIPDCSYWHYALQQNLYKYIVEKNYGLKISAMHLVVLHSNYNKYHLINVPPMQHEIEMIINDLNKTNG